MNEATQAVANSNLLFILCASVILIVVFQAMLFLFKALKRADELGVPANTRKKIMMNSALFTIVPSIPIIIILSTLAPALGLYVPWLRLSVVGSAVYENLAADTTAKTFGLYGIADPLINPSIFVAVVWVMTLGVIAYPLVNVFFLKRFTSKLAKAKTKGSGGFIEVAIPAIFVGMIGPLGLPSLVNFENPGGIAALIVAGVCVMMSNKIATITKIQTIKEFSFPISMVIGMGTAALVTHLFV